MSRTPNLMARVLLFAATAVTGAAAMVAAAYRFWIGFAAACVLSVFLGFASRSYGVRLPGDDD